MATTTEITASTTDQLVGATSTATATSTTTDKLINQVTEISGAVTQQVTTATAELWQAFLTLDWTAPTWDLIILVFFGVSVLLYGFVLGRDRVVAILVSTYLSLAVATNVPYLDRLPDIFGAAFAYQLVSFLVVFILVFIMLSRSRTIQGLGNLGGNWLHTVVFSLLQVGLFISIVISFLPADGRGQLSDFTQFVFTSDLGRFMWIVLPIVALVFLGGRRGRYDFEIDR